MTKSQNTKNEQLTEQWKKGELPSGEYYIIDDLGLHTTDRYYPSHGFGAELPQAVLAPVPSYDEWQAKLEENAQLKELLARAKGIITAYRLTGNQSTYSDNDMKECVAKIDEVLK